MAGDNKTELEILVEIRDALKNLDKFEKAAKETTKKTSDSFETLKTVAGAAVAVFASKQVLDFFAKGVDAAVAQEDAMGKLAQALKLTGEESDKALSQFKDFADEMEASTGFADDAVLSQIAIAKSFGATNDEAKLLVKTAADLSAVTGDSLESSVQQLGKSLQGVASKSPELRKAFDGLSESELRAGKGLAAAAEAFGGSAVAKMDTFSGAVKGAANAFGNLEESFGKIIINNKPLIALIKAARDIFTELEGSVNDNSDTLNEFVSGSIKAFVVSIDVAIEATAFLVRAIQGVLVATHFTFDGAAEILATFTGALAEVYLALHGNTGTAVALADASAALGDFADASTAATADAIAGFEKTNAAVGKFQDKFTTAAQKIFDANGRVKKSSIDAAEKSAEELRRLALAQAKLAEEAKKAAEAEKLFAEAMADLDKEFKQQIEDLTKNPLAVAIKINVAAADLTGFQKQLAAGAIGIIGQVLNGAAGAKSLISEGAGAFADALLPGIGPAVTGIVAKLAEGPDATKKFVREFIEQAPKIMDALGDAAPAFVEALVDSLINEGGAIRIGVSIARAMALEGVWKSVGKQIGLEFGTSLQAANIRGTITAGFRQGAQDILSAFTFSGIATNQQISDAFTKGGEDIVNAFGVGAVSVGTSIETAIANAITELGAFFSQIGDGFAAIQLPTIPTPAWLDDFRAIVEKLLGFALPGTGGGGGNIKIGGKDTGIKNPFGKHASGLDSVPSGFPNDSYIAGLSSKERVVQAPANQDLTAFLEKANSGGLELSADSIAMLAKMINLGGGNQGGNVTVAVQLDKRTLAKAMFSLSELNARTA